MRKNFIIKSTSFQIENEYFMKFLKYNLKIYYNSFYTNWERRWGITILVTGLDLSTTPLTTWPSPYFLTQIHILSEFTLSLFLNINGRSCMSVSIFLVCKFMVVLYVMVKIVHLFFQYLIYVMLVRAAGSQCIWVSHWDQYRWAGYQTRNVINYVVS